MPWDAPSAGLQTGTSEPLGEFQGLGVLLGPAGPCWALQEASLCSKIRHFGLFGLTVHQAHEHGFDNTGFFFSLPTDSAQSICKTGEGWKMGAQQPWTQCELQTQTEPVCELSRDSPVASG